MAVYLNNAANNCAIDREQGMVCGAKKGEGARWRGDTGGGCGVMGSTPITTV